METRIIRQVRLYKLILNPMTGRCESGSVVAISLDYCKLVAWYNSQKAPTEYRDGGWNKTFKKGSRLEWFNPVSSLELNELGVFGHGIVDEWIPEGVFKRIAYSNSWYAYV